MNIQRRFEDTEDALCKWETTLDIDDENNACNIRQKTIFDDGTSEYSIVQLSFEEAIEISKIILEKVKL